MYLNRITLIGFIGSDAEKETQQLSPADWDDVFFDQGKQVREGVAKNGEWNVEIAKAGNYRFELRRWPREADAPMALPLTLVRLDPSPRNCSPVASATPAACE